MQTLEEKNVVVIGGTSGIGLATALLAAEHGARVWAASRSQKRIEQVQQSAPDRVTFRQVDTHQPDALARLCDEVGTIDHLISAATGANRTRAPFMDQTPEQFSEAFGKFWGYTNVIRAGVPHLSEQGSVVLVSGVPARKCKPGMSSISCVGNAVEGLVRALALELAPRRVNAVAPGIIDTPMFDWMGEKKAEALGEMCEGFPLKRVGQAREVADAIVFLLTADYITGTTIDVDGGQLLP